MEFNIDINKLTLHFYKRIFNGIIIKNILLERTNRIYSIYYKD